MVAICEADALREASYFADRLRAEHMPLAGLVLNRTHPPLADLPPAAAGSPPKSWSGSAPLAAAVLRHPRRAARGAGGRTAHARAGSTGCTPTCRCIEVPALPSDAHDLPALREIGRRLTAA